MNLKPFGKAAAACCVCLLLSILLGILAMTCVYILPTGRMLTQADRSLPLFENEGTGFFWAPEEKSTRLDGFTDAVMLQTAVYARQESPLNAAMRCARMEFSDEGWSPVESLTRYVYGERSGQVLDYARYWHGYLLLLKPLLLFFSLGEIRMLDAMVQLILAAAVLLVAFQKRGVKLALPLGLSMLAINPISTALSMQYSSIYILTLAAVLCMLLTGSWEKSWGYLVFLFLGIGTAFFDLMTYPAAAVGICLGLQALMSRENGKDRLLKTIGSGAAWAFGYGGMWSGKWLAASLITGTNVLSDAMEQAQYRSGSSVDAAEGSLQAGFGSVVARNLAVLKTPAALLLLAVLVGVLLWLLCTGRCRFAPDKAGLVSLAVAFAVPFVWYFLVRNHSMVHDWMTHRDLAAAVFALSGFVCFSLRRQPRT